eukprot:Polyplicarium_translucidae@DN3822_c0_g1_i1.p2
MTADNAQMVEDQFSLLVIDSIMALFRVDFSGRGELSERQQCLNKVLSKIMKLAEQFNLTVVLTNHVMSDPSGAMTFVASSSKPVGGAWVSCPSQGAQGTYWVTRPPPGCLSGKARETSASARSTTLHPCPSRSAFSSCQVKTAFGTPNAFQRAG